MARCDYVIGRIGRVDCARVFDAKVNLESRLVGFAAGAVDHL